MAGIYIHIPFCATKCIYCDFFSVAVTAENAVHILRRCLRNMTRGWVSCKGKR